MVTRFHNSIFGDQKESSICTFLASMKVTLPIGFWAYVVVYLPLKLHNVNANNSVKWCFFIILLCVIQTFIPSSLFAVCLVSFLK